MRACVRAGLLDMLGNTWEWTSSAFPAPAGSRQQMFALRGASWIDTADGSANHRAEVGAKWVTLLSAALTTRFPFTFRVISSKSQSFFMSEGSGTPPPPPFCFLIVLCFVERFPRGPNLIGIGLVLVPQDGQHPRFGLG